MGYTQYHMDVLYHCASFDQFHTPLATKLPKNLTNPTSHFTIQYCQFLIGPDIQRRRRGSKSRFRRRYKQPMILDEPE